MPMTGVGNSAPKPIRVLVGDMPRPLHVIVEETLRRESDIELLATTRRGRRDRGASSGRTADVVIVAESGADGPVALDELLLDNPSVKLLVLTADGRQAHLFQATRLIELSSQRLADAIRSAAQPGQS